MKKQRSREAEKQRASSLVNQVGRSVVAEVVVGACICRGGGVEGRGHTQAEPPRGIYTVGEKKCHYNQATCFLSSSTEMSMPRHSWNKVFDTLAP